MTTTSVDTRRGEWLALHIFYAANPNPLLIKCVRPLVTDLYRENLISNYFFINYWLEGPHVRLRLRPSTVDNTEVVKARAEAAIESFLRTRPALYEVDSGFLSEFYNSLFDIEMKQAEKSDYIGDDGRMNMRPNNSFAYLPYEPEYGKYGGPHGIELAEWHFRHSSDLVIDAVRTKNVHLRTVLLGTSAQLMMVMAATFLSETDELVEYLDSYYRFWHTAFGGTSFIGSKEYETNYEAMKGDLGRRFQEIRAYVAGDSSARLPAFLRGWAAHCHLLAGRATNLAEKGLLTFRSWDGTRDEVITDPAQARRVLLSPYMHMTNNRLHVTIRDEAYLSFVLGNALKDSRP